MSRFCFCLELDYKVSLISMFLCMWVFSHWTLYERLHQLWWLTLSSQYHELFSILRKQLADLGGFPAVWFILNEDILDVFYFFFLVRCLLALGTQCLSVQVLSIYCTACFKLPIRCTMLGCHRWKIIVVKESWGCLWSKSSFLHPSVWVTRWRPSHWSCDQSRPDVVFWPCQKSRYFIYVPAN